MEKEKDKNEEKEETKKVTEKAPEVIPTPISTIDTPISLAAFLNMHTLVRHIRWKYERLHRALALELHTHSEWTETTGLGKVEENKK